jgi:aspartyl-tRNA(Asn)/glutamyl-tRNA(Gln) amidotransferase subunit B
MTNVKKAIEYEFERQCKMADAGEEIHSETRNFDALKGTTFSMRSKELVNDYRFFPEPDLPPLVVSQEWISNVKSVMPALPKELYNKFNTEMGLGEYDASILTESREIAEYFLAICDHTQNYKAAANWTMGAVKNWVNSNASHILVFPLSAATIAELISSIDQGVINFSIAEQQVFPALLINPSQKVNDIIANQNLALMDDDESLQTWINEVLAEFPDKVEDYRSGKTNLIGLFIGQVKKKSSGKADPKRTNELLIKALS